MAVTAGGTADVAATGLEARGEDTGDAGLRAEGVDMGTELREANLCFHLFNDILLRLVFVLFVVFLFLALGGIIRGG